MGQILRCHHCAIPLDDGGQDDHDVVTNLVTPTKSFQRAVVCTDDGKWSHWARLAGTHDPRREHCRAGGRRPVGCDRTNCQSCLPRPARDGSAPGQAPWLAWRSRPFRTGAGRSPARTARVWPGRPRRLRSRVGFWSLAHVTSLHAWQWLQCAGTRSRKNVRFPAMS
jgi:hypothetical protein